MSSISTPWCREGICNFANSASFSLLCQNWHADLEFACKFCFLVSFSVLFRSHICGQDIPRAAGHSSFKRCSIVKSHGWQTCWLFSVSSSPIGRSTVFISQCQTGTENSFYVRVSDWHKEQSLYPSVRLAQRTIFISQCQTGTKNSCYIPVSDWHKEQFFISQCQTGTKNSLLIPVSDWHKSCCNYESVLFSFHNVTVYKKKKMITCLTRFVVCPLEH